MTNDFDFKKLTANVIEFNSKLINYATDVSVNTTKDISNFSQSVIAHHNAFLKEHMHESISGHLVKFNDHVSNTISTWSDTLKNLVSK